MSHFFSRFHKHQQEQHLYWLSLAGLTAGYSIKPPPSSPTIHTIIGDRSTRARLLTLTEAEKDFCACRGLKSYTFNISWQQHRLYTMFCSPVLKRFNLTWLIDAAFPFKTHQKESTYVKNCHLHHFYLSIFSCMYDWGNTISAPIRHSSSPYFLCRFT